MFLPKADILSAFGHLSVTDENMNVSPGRAPAVIPVDLWGRCDSSGMMGNCLCSDYIRQTALLHRSHFCQFCTQHFVKKFIAEVEADSITDECN